MSRFAILPVVPCLLILGACKSVSTTSIAGSTTYTFKGYKVVEILDHLEDEEFTTLGMMDVTVTGDRVVQEVTIEPFASDSELLAQLEAKLGCTVSEDGGGTTIALE